VYVNTRGGAVTLEGTVGADAQRTRAEEIARETAGVTRLVNRLTVRPAERE
jgi:osmotically-inducible protein OsmY